MVTYLMLLNWTDQGIKKCEGFAEAARWGQEAREELGW